MSIEPRLLSVQCITPAGLHRIGYAEWGEPDNPRVLVAVHGLTRVGRDFDNLARALAPYYRVICPDIAGRGRSDRLANPMLYQVPTYIADMVTLLARANAKTVHWFGTSMGGMIGMGLASLAHSPIQKLILNDVGPVLKAEALARIAGYLGRPVRFRSVEEATDYIRSISAPFGPHTDAEWRYLTEVVVKPAGDEWVLHYDPDLAVPFKADLEANPGRGDLLLWDVYDRIVCPTLAVRGAFSDLLAADTHAEMARRGPRAKLATIEGVGHAPTFMHGDQIELAREFLLA
jgi:pimeloyl-ACP methyl ester carboxylesterase